MASDVYNNPNEAHQMYDDRVFDDAKYTAIQRQNQVKQVTFFRNGDPFFAPKRYILNEKHVGNWDNLLQHVTDLVRPRNGYVERLYTPTQGHRVRSFEDLRTGEAYVAAAKAERFYPMPYASIRELPPIRAGNFRKQRAYDAQMGDWRPRVTNVGNSSLNVLPKVLHIFRNGDPFSTAITILLKPSEQFTWAAVLNAISDRVRLQNTKAIRKLFRMDGKRVRMVEELENGAYYVAAARERFDNVNYGQGLPRLHLGTVLKKEQPKFLSKPVTPPGQRPEQHRKGWHSDGESIENDFYRRDYTAVQKRDVFDDNGFVGKPVRFTKLRSHETTGTSSSLTRENNSSAQQEDEQQRNGVRQQTLEEQEQENEQDPEQERQKQQEGEQEHEQEPETELDQKRERDQQSTNNWELNEADEERESAR